MMPRRQRRGVRGLLGFLVCALLMEQSQVSASPGIVWIPVPSTESPSPGVGQAMVYEAERHASVLFGGSDADAQTWIFKGGRWKAVFIEGPSRRSDHAMAYDGKRHVTLLFGGSSTGGVLDDTWRFDGRSWQRLFPESSPPARSHHVMAFDPGQETIILFGGIDNAGHEMDDTWEWDGAHWGRRTPSTRPRARADATLQQSTRRGALLLFGGSSFDGRHRRFESDTWVWDGATWQLQSTPSSPPARADAAAVFVRSRGRMVLFGGYNLSPTSPICGAGALSDMWEWDGEWRSLSALSNALCRRRHVLTSDDELEVLVLFGGEECDALSCDDPVSTSVCPIPPLPMKPSASRGD